MRPLPILRGLREHQQLSQRALAEKSGVAHDTIGQLERGEREARASTIRKLADALNVTPSILTSRFENLWSLTGEELLRIGGPEAVEVVREYLTWAGGVQQKRERRDGNVRATYEAVPEVRVRDHTDDVIDLTAVLEDIALAYAKLNPYEDKHPFKGELVEMTEASLLLARVSADLLHRVASNLEAKGYWN